MAAGARTVLLAVVLAALVASPAQAGTLTVTKTGDTSDGACDADCSLREAVSAANVAPDHDTIVLPAGVHRLVREGGDDTNELGDLDVARTTTIRGAGAAATTIQMLAFDRVIDHIGGDLVLEDLTVTGGRVEGTGIETGGGIDSKTDGTLTLRRVVVRGNSVRGAVAGARGAGGGVYKHSGLIVARDSTVVGNRADGMVGGFGGGIGVSSLSGSGDLQNVTIAANDARTVGGGLYLGAAPVAAAHVTIVDNVAASQAATSGVGISLRSSVVAANHSVGNECGPPPTSLGGNVGSASCGFVAPGDTVTAGPRLAPLSSDAIPVFVPLAGSPALDRATGACPAADARGLARPQGRACDAGAAERPVPAGAPAPAPPPAPAPEAPARPPVPLVTPPPAGTAATLVLRARLASLPRRLALDRPRRRVAVRLRCLAGSACRGRLRMTVRRRAGRRLRTLTLGRASFSLRAGRRKTIRVPLTATGRRLVRRSRSVRVTLVADLGGVALRRTAAIRRG